jgi:quercetin dioxygenase-like cupin family protein
VPLQRIRTTSAGELAGPPSSLRAEGLQLSAGKTILDRQAAGATALVAVNGRIKVGTGDDDALLAAGEGVLLPAGTHYSLRAEEDSLAMLFELPPGKSVEADGGASDVGALEPGMSDTAGSDPA